MRGTLATLGWIYFGATFLIFLMAAFVTLTGWWPSTWQVPWSDLGKFAETKDGIVLVDIQMWSRIELYDRQGRFQPCREKERADLRGVFSLNRSCAWYPSGSNLREETRAACKRSK